MCVSQFLLFVRLLWQNLPSYNLFAWWQLMWSCKSGSIIVISQCLQFTDWTILWNFHIWRWSLFFLVKHLVHSPHENIMTVEYVMTKSSDALPLIDPSWIISHRGWFVHYWFDNTVSIDIWYVNQNHFIVMTCGYHFNVTNVKIEVYFLTNGSLWYTIFINFVLKDDTKEHG